MLCYWEVYVDFDISVIFQRKKFIKGSKGPLLYIYVRRKIFFDKFSP